MRSICAVLAFSCLPLTLAAQDSWTKVTTTVAPLPRTGHAMAYDSKRGVVVLFGGRSNTSGTYYDTWEYNGKSWTLVPTGRPARRYKHNMAYDESRGVVVMFGGVSQRNERLRDTWEYDGKTWVNRGSVAINEGRYSFAMAYDALRKHVVRFGGGGAGGSKGDTHVWDGKAWKQVATTGPSPRTDPVMAYDRVAQRVRLTGGTSGSTETWEWDGSKWSVLKPTSTHNIASGTRMVYQAANGRILIIRPASAVATWVFKGNAWRMLTTKTAPGWGNDLQLTYDSKRERVVGFGGVGANETWELTSTVTAKATFTAFGSGCKGSAGTPQLASVAGHAPYIGEKFRLSITGLPTTTFATTFGLIGASKAQWQASKLPLDLAFMGFPGCKLHVSPDFVQQIPNNSGTATWELDVPNLPGLVGLVVYVQAWVVDGRTVAVTNGGEAKVGSR